MTGNSNKSSSSLDAVGSTCLCDSVEEVVRRYLGDLGPVDPANLYELVLAEVERPLLKTILEHAGGNQSKAATMLGINRNTLRKKTLRYGLNGD